MTSFEGVNWGVLRASTLWGYIGTPLKWGVVQELCLGCVVKIRFYFGYKIDIRHLVLKMI